MHERVVPAAQGPTAMSSGSVDATPTIASCAAMVPSAWIAITASGLPESLWPQYTPAWSRLAASPDSSGSPRGTRPTSRAVVAYRTHGGGGGAAGVTGAIRMLASIASRPRIATTLPDASHAPQSPIGFAARAAHGTRSHGRDHRPSRPRPDHRAPARDARDGGRDRGPARYDACPYAAARRRERALPAGRGYQAGRGLRRHARRDHDP